MLAVRCVHSLGERRLIVETEGESIFYYSITFDIGKPLSSVEHNIYGQVFEFVPNALPHFLVKLK